MAYDPIRLEVFKKLLSGIGEEMGVTLCRTAFSPNIKERKDFSCALFDGEGRMIAQAEDIPVHLGAMPMSVLHAIEHVDMAPGDKVLLNFPGANRDPAAFEKPDEVILDRKRNRHMAFGLGIHRCAGSNLARMEMQVALRTWFDRIGEFELEDVDAVIGTTKNPGKIAKKLAAHRRATLKGLHEKETKKKSGSGLTIKRTNKMKPKKKRR